MASDSKALTPHPLDTTIELSAKGDSSLKDVDHLFLEVTSNGRVLAKVKLLSRAYQPETWDVDDDFGVL
jgi:hypothetical protein